MFFDILWDILKRHFNNYKIREKTEKHQRANAFRAQIVQSAQRNHAISELVNKSVFDEADKVRIVVLFQKKQYAEGCQAEYAKLIKKVEESGDETLIEKARSFSRKL